MRLPNAPVARDHSIVIALIRLPDGQAPLVVHLLEFDQDFLARNQCSLFDESIDSLP